MKPENSEPNQTLSAEAWLEREPATQATQNTNEEKPMPNDDNNPYTAPSSPPQQPDKKPKKHHPLAIIIAMFFAFLVVFGVIFGAMYFANQSHPVEEKSETPTKPTAPTTLRVYMNADQKAAQIDQQDKTIASVVLPDGKTTIQTIAVTDKAALVTAINGIGDAEPNGYLITSDGKVTDLTPSIASTVSQASTKSRAYGFLDEKNNFVSVACQNTSCVLNSMDLKTGTLTPILTQGYTPPSSPVATSTSLALLGISDKNIAYLTTYAPNNTQDAIGTVTAVDLTSGNTKKTLIMPQAAVRPAQFSPDYKHALFTQSQDSATGNVISWDAGSTAKVSGTIGNGRDYVWSPNSKRALSLNSPLGQTSTLLSIPAETAQQSVLKTFPTTNKVILTVLGWADDATIQYKLESAGSEPEYHSYNIDSGSDTTLTTKDSYLAPPHGSTLSSSGL